MARVEIGAQEFGSIIRNGQPVPNATVQIATLAGPAATHWSAVTGGSSSTANLSTDVDGVVGLGGAARFVDEGTYNLTSGGTTRRVEAVSGATLVSAESGIANLANGTTIHTRLLGGNGTQSDFDSEPNIPILIRTYHGNAGGLPITGRPQGWQAISKYFAATTADSAQGGSIGAFLVDSGTPFTQTFPLTGMEGDAVAQGGNTLSNKAVGVAGSAEAQNTAHINDAICFYAAAKSASAAGASIDRWHGLYVENPAVVGTVTDSMGVYSRPRIQTETGIVIGVTQANTTAAVKGTTLYVAGTNTSGNAAVRIVKKSGSTDDIFQITDSGGQTQFIVNGNGQLIVKTGGAAHSAGSAVGAMIAMGNIATAPSANFSGGTGGFLYVEAGALKFRGGAGTVTTIAVT